ncbi:hypothetical protein N7447_009506 [Penicillium robsamsonii]|uniref:uncharacterized protein n=1 Tax=Penicillium robsamsonii TaxID=1792511 RepID=UPI002547B7D7|nr:uncharacterized protein N7447_009506 [Penicillium robsamsonii]KAJ5817273.1 hypothetical protein N7447_009506 [Penicillium robsamsonii]
MKLSYHHAWMKSIRRNHSLTFVRDKSYVAYGCHFFADYTASSMISNAQWGLQSTVRMGLHYMGLLELPTMQNVL